MNTKYLGNLSVLLVAGACILGTGCVVRERGPAAGVAVSGEVQVPDAPPPAAVDTMTISPGPNYVWIAGGWAWSGQWIWERGHWDLPPRAGAVWVPHRYVYRNGQHVFIRGGWR